ncbi:MAG: alpha/beta hydrolase [Deltaproteobacteria bacterium]|jgi:alpha-beta hydrolase superfamily lysophospholipase|nr:alpha/beta hydrolase [Deltaproteobacteria bacterium]
MAVVKQIQFLSEKYGLKGYLHLPPVAKPPFVIGSHGLFSDKDSPKQIALAQHCNRLQMAYFRFDHRGCGESKAPFNAVTSLEARRSDLKAAVKMLRSRSDLGDPLGLFGSSMGASVCLSAARELTARAVVTWAAPIRSTDLMGPQDQTNTGLKSPLQRHPFDISPAIAGLRNLLIFHGDADQTVPIAHAREILASADDPKKLVVFPHSDHRMSHPVDQRAFVQEAARWFQIFLKQ